MSEKESIALMTAAIYIGSVAFTLAVFGLLVWVTGLYGWLIATVTKDVLGYVAAALVIVITLAFMTTGRSHR